MKEIIILLLTGLSAGMLSGVLGIGGGIIVIPVLVLILGFSQQMAQGTSLALLLPPIGLFAVINYYKSGFVDFKAAGLMIVTFIIGSYFSSKFATNIDENMLKKIFGIFLVIYGIKLFFEKS
ncbi:sulfite exporter TauE/SafE family protein [Candidatus Kapaibacterium sp.]